MDYERKILGIEDDIDAIKKDWRADTRRIKALEEWRELMTTQKVGGVIPPLVQINKNSQGVAALHETLEALANNIEVLAEVSRGNATAAKANADLVRVIILALTLLLLVILANWVV